MRTITCFVLLLLAVEITSAQGARPIAHWSFDDSHAAVAMDSVSGTQDRIGGEFRFVPGVRGEALEFDGYTTHIARPQAKALALEHGFTVEVWVALDAYPWNWAPILDQEKDEQAGFLCGIDPFGHIGVHAAVQGAWQVLSSTAQIPLKRWTHVACSFDPERGLKVFLNGQPAGELAARGLLTVAERTGILIGRVRDKHLPVPSGLIHPHHAVYYSLEGALDELSLYDRALPTEEIAAQFRAVQVPPGATSPWAVLPAGVGGHDHFGASYETLHFQPSWDRLRRIGPLSDVVVRFDGSPIRLVFWQGLNYVPAWVTENNKWYTDEFMEAYGAPHCPDGEDCEPMSDKQERYSHVRILENTPARVVVHWRYALSESENYKGSYADPLTGWFDWGDEYWTVYPDGVAVRKQVLWSSHLDGIRKTDPIGDAPHEFQETIVVNGPGEWPEDNINLDALTLANMQGETSVYSWKPKARSVFDYPHGPDAFPLPAQANIEWINLKSSWKPFQIAPLPAKFTAYNGEKTYSTFEWWNHWPVGQIDSSGRPALAPDRASHTSLSHIYWPPSEETRNTVTKLLMDGLTSKTAGGLVPLARSWLSPPHLETVGIKSRGYDPAERAYILMLDGPPRAFTISLAATPESPLVNPAFIVEGWDRGARATVNGSACRPTGAIGSPEGAKIVIWCAIESDGPVQIKVEPE